MEENEKNRIVPVYQRIQESKNPVFIWGTGGLARDVYRYCRHFHVKVAGFFVNVGECIERFEEQQVYTLEEMLQQYAQVDVIIGHHHYKDGIEFLQTIDSIQQIYYLTTVSYDMWDPVSVDLLRKDSEDWESLWKDLEEQKSKDCLSAYFKSKLYDISDYMFSCYDGEEGYFNEDFLRLGNEESLLDIGAYRGSAITAFAKAVDGQYNKVIALEPEQENYEYLKNMIAREQWKNVILKQRCAWKRTENVRFSGNGELGGITTSEGEDSQWFPAVAIDDLRKEGDISIIKINFPFYVDEILEGGSKLLQEKQPKLIIRVGFNEKLVLDTYKKIKELNTKYAIYFRYTIGMPEGLTLYAV